MKIPKPRTDRGVTLIQLIFLVLVLVLVGVIIYFVWMLADNLLPDPDKPNKGQAPAWVAPNGAKLVYHGTDPEAAEDAVYNTVRTIGLENVEIVTPGDKPLVWYLESTTNFGVHWTVLKAVGTGHIGNIELDLSGPHPHEFFRCYAITNGEWE